MHYGREVILFELSALGLTTLTNQLHLRIQNHETFIKLSVRAHARRFCPSHLFLTYTLHVVYYWSLLRKSNKAREIYYILYSLNSFVCPPNDFCCVFAANSPSSRDFSYVHTNRNEFRALRARFMPTWQPT